MIFRVSTKLCKKLKGSTPGPAPVDHNPFADWSCHLFTSNRTQYVNVTNTTTLYSVVMYGRGIHTDEWFIKQACSSIREVMKADGNEWVAFVVAT